MGEMTGRIWKWVAKNYLVPGQNVGGLMGINIYTRVAFIEINLRLECNIY